MAGITDKGIEISTGDIIGIINSDDLLYSGAIEFLLQNIDENTDVYFGRGIRMLKDGSKKPYKVSSDISTLEYDMCLFHPGVFVKKDLYIKYGGFDKKYKCVMDRELLLRFRLRMKRNGAVFKYLDYPMAVFRDGGVSDRQFFTKVLPENEEISIRYGMPRWKAHLLTIKKKMYMKLVFCIKGR